MFGFSAQKTLDIAQALYERHKLISYPRTDSRYLSQDVAGTLPRIVKTIAEPYRQQMAPGTGEQPLGRRFVDDSKVRDHHAIIPTITVPGSADLTPDERENPRSDLPPAARRMARGSYRVGHNRDYGYRERPITDRCHSRNSGAASGMEGSGPANRRKNAKRGLNRVKRNKRFRPVSARSEPGRPWKSNHSQKDARAQTLYRGDVVDRDGNRGQALDEKELSDAMKRLVWEPRQPARPLSKFC